MSFIYLVRHGQASIDKEDYDQLSPLGVEQSQVLGKELAQRIISFKHIVGGLMTRHLETCNNCFSKFDHKPPLKQEEAWNEYGFMEIISKHDPTLDKFDKIVGRLRNEENPNKAFQALLNNAISDWMNDKHDYDTTWVAFKARVIKAIQDLGDQLNKDDNAIVFTSGGPISVIVCNLLGIPESQFTKIQQRTVNASITKIYAGKSGLSLSSYNEYGYFEHNPKLITYR